MQEPTQNFEGWTPAPSADLDQFNVLNNVMKTIKNPNLLPRRKLQIDGQQYSYVDLEEVMAIIGVAINEQPAPTSLDQVQRTLVDLNEEVSGQFKKVYECLAKLADLTRCEKSERLLEITKIHDYLAQLINKTVLDKARQQQSTRFSAVPEQHTVKPDEEAVAPATPHYKFEFDLSSIPARHHAYCKAKINEILNQSKPIEVVIGEVERVIKDIKNKVDAEKIADSIPEAVRTWREKTGRTIRDNLMSGAQTSSDLVSSLVSDDTTRRMVKSLTGINDLLALVTPGNKHKEQFNEMKRPYAQVSEDKTITCCKCGFVSVIKFLPIKLCDDGETLPVCPSCEQLFAADPNPQ